MIAYYPIPTCSEAPEAEQKYYQDIEKVDTRSRVEAFYSNTGIAKGEPYIGAFYIEDTAPFVFLQFDTYTSISDLETQMQNKLVGVSKVEIIHSENTDIKFIFWGVTELKTTEDNTGGPGFTASIFREDSDISGAFTISVINSSTKTVTIPAGSSHVSVHAYGNAEGVLITDDVTGEVNDPEGEGIEGSEIFELPMLYGVGSYQGLTVTVPEERKVKIHAVSRDSDFDIIQA